MIIFPSNCKSNRDRFEFAYAAQEKLRLEHNEMGRRFREKEITKEEWEKYLDNNFNPKNRELSYFIAPNREAVLKQIIGVSEIDYKDELQIKKISDTKELFKKSTRFDIDLDNLCQ